ncbi:ligand-binding sensor domain-containing protein [Aliikangiella sp. IMCC44653]
MIKKILYLLFLSYLSCGEAKNLENTSFKHISNETRLSQKTVQTIFQDKLGFMWFGTQEGLNRYDGREIRIFRHSLTDIGSISHDVIRDIGEDKNGDLWIATSGGLNRYKPESESFERVALVNSNGETVTRLNEIYLDTDGILWVGTDGSGVFYLEPEAKTKKPKFVQYKAFQHLFNADIRAIFKDSRGRLWLGSDSDGVTIVEGGAMVGGSTRSSSDLALLNSPVRNIYEDRKGKIWVATRGGGLSRFEELSKTFKTYQQSDQPNSLNHNRVYQIYEDSRGILWIATDEGLAIYQPETDDFTRIQHKPSQPTGLSHNRVLAIFEDRGGMMWFGTLSGLNQWNPLAANFIHYRHVSEDNLSLSNNMVYSLSESIDGNIFIGTFGGGMNVLNPITQQVAPFEHFYGKQLSSQRITSSLVDSDANLWIGTISSGIEKINLNSGESIKYKHEPNSNNGLSDNGITNIMQDSRGDIWITTYNGGLHKYYSETNTFKAFSRKTNVKNSIANDNLFHVMEDDDGYLWVSSDGGGISRFDRGSTQFEDFTYSEKNSKSLSGNNVISITQDSKGRFWIGTLGNGLNRWEPQNRRKGINEFQHYTIDNGLNSSTVYGVLEDSSGYIWVSTTRGLNKLDPETDKIEHYNLADEIHYNELNQGAMLRTSSNRLFFGGTNGVSAFDPEDIVSNPHVPNVVLTKISSENKKLLFDEPLQELSEITFSHNDYLISFEFAALDFAQPNKNRYQYKLEGFDSEWIDGGHFNRATFTNLPAGSYLLKVKGSNNDGIWSQAAINLRVNVLPAPWLSWWAFLVYGLSFCLFIFMLIRKQAKRLAEHELFQEHVSANVEQKTELYQKSNQLLQKQVSLLSESANVDPQTGVPTQKFICDLLHFNLDWIRKSGIKPSHFENKLVFLIVDLNADKLTEAELNDAVVQFSRQLEVELPNNTALVRWDQHRFALLFNVEKRVNVNTVIEAIASIYQQVFALVSPQKKPMIAYSLLPYAGVSQAIPNAQDILMLTEHALYSLKVQASSDEKNKRESFSAVGIISTSRLLDDYTFKQLLASKNLLEVKDVFEFSLIK